jgi:hypothetical protein
MASTSSRVILLLASAVGGAGIYALTTKLLCKTKKKPDPESDHSVGHGLVWHCISRAMRSRRYKTDEL